MMGFMPQMAQGPVSAAAYGRLWSGSLTGSAVEGDREFYRRMARRTGGPILELGAGTGRIALPLAADGHAVTALDLSPHMLAIARAKAALVLPDRRPRFVRGTMERFAFPRRFRLVIIPFRAFQHLLTPEAQRRCL